MVASKEAVGLLFVCVYAYAYLGVILFGGLIYEGNPNLEDTDYRDSNFDILNFNDMGLALVSLFVNLTVSFVPEFYFAFTAVLRVPFVSEIFWVSFYVVGGLMIFNVYASFIIDLFLQNYETGNSTLAKGDLVMIEYDLDLAKKNCTKALLKRLAFDETKYRAHRDHKGELLEVDEFSVKVKFEDGQVCEFISKNVIKVENTETDSNGNIIKKSFSGCEKIYKEMFLEGLEDGDSEMVELLSRAPSMKI